MSIYPTQIQRQAEDVERIEKDLADAKATPPEITDPPSEPETPVLVAPPLPTPQPTPTSEQLWEQRYKTLDGKYRAEVPRMAAELKVLKARLEEVTATPKPTTEAPASKVKSPKVTEKDTEVFGADLIDLIKRQAEEMISDTTGAYEAKLSELAAENARLRENVTGLSAQNEVTAMDRFEQQLKQNIPGFDAINVSPQFLDWLEVVDPLSGLSRRIYLDDAASKFDTARTTAVFKAFIAETAAQPPAPVDAKPPQNLDVQKQITPGKSKSPVNAQADPTDKVWTTSEIEQFYKDASLGKYKGRAEEAMQIEASIDLAVSNNRVKK